MEKRYRYPGAYPFTEIHLDVFFGRQEESEALFRMIRLERQVVLFGMSGTGKTSLLNAGLLPLARKEGGYQTVAIRLGGNHPEEKNTPVKTTLNYLKQLGGEPTFLEKLDPGHDSIWYKLKRLQLNGMSEKGFLLVFDQFEELFTYPVIQILQFKKQLAEAFHTTVPQRLRKILEERLAENPDFLTTEEIDQLNRNFELKLFFAIRSDRLHLLHGLSDYFPNILTRCYELKPLNVSQAEEAIFLPARKRNASFISPSFNFEDDAFEALLEYLQKEARQGIEPFQLQILCRTIEDRVVARDLKMVTMNELDDLADIYQNFYFFQIGQLPGRENQQAARRLIEDGLVFEEDKRRLALLAGQIQKEYNVAPELLEQLVDLHLLRAIPNPEGDYAYELSHDSLIDPVLKAKRERQVEERRQAWLEERKTEAAREQRRNRRRWIAVGSLFAVLVAAGSLFLYFQTIAMNNQLARVNLELEEKNLDLETTNEEISASVKALQAKGDTLEVVKTLLRERYPGGISLTEIINQETQKLEEERKDQEMRKKERLALVGQLFGAGENQRITARIQLLRLYQDDEPLPGELAEVAARNISVENPDPTFQILYMLQQLGPKVKTAPDIVKGYLDAVEANLQLTPGGKAETQIRDIRAQLE